jgi:VWFA-related protein
MARLAVVVLALAAAPLVGAQSPPRAAPLVRIDAIAVDARGRAVRDLTVEDFEVAENGANRRVEDVRFVAPATSNEARLFAVYLDEYHISPGPAVERARAMLQRLVDEEIGPRDLIAFVKPLDALPQIRLTNDRAVIRDALESFAGRKGDYEPRSAFERDFIAASPGRIDAVREQIAISALNAISARLGSLRAGRKTLVVISEGFPRIPPRRGEEGLPSIETVIRAANRGGVSIYPVDPHALSGASTGPAPDPSHSDILRTLAVETGGRALLSAGDQEGIRRIVADASGYYLIAFEPLGVETAGRFKPVDLRVRRAGVELRARKAYWLPPSAPSRPRTEVALTKMPDVTGRPSAYVTPWFGIERTHEGKARMQFVWEPPARAPEDAAPVPARVRLKVFRPDGRALLEQPVASASEMLPGVVQTVTFDAPAERFRVQLSIYDAAATLIDTDVRDMDVPSLTGGLAVGTPRVFRARNEAEQRAIEADRGAAPVVTRDFSSLDRLLLRVPIYAASRYAILTARLVGPTVSWGNGGSGQDPAKRELSVTQARDPQVYEVALPLAGLPAGPYRVELSAVSSDLRAEEVVHLRITP